MIDTFTQIRRPERTFTSRSKFGISRCLSARHRTLQFSACISQPRGPRPYRRFGSVLWSASAAVYPNSSPPPYSTNRFHGHPIARMRRPKPPQVDQTAPARARSDSCGGSNQHQGEVHFVSGFERLKFDYRLSQSVRGNACRCCGPLKKQNTGVNLIIRAVS